MVTTAVENTDPNQSPAAAPTIGNNKPPRGNNNKKRVSISPKKPTLLLSPSGSHRAANGGRRRRSSSHFEQQQRKKNKKSKKKSVVVDTDDDESESEGDEDSDIEFTLDGATNIDSGEKHTIGGSGSTSPKKTNNNKKKSTQQQQRRRRRSSARFLRLSSDGGAAASSNNSPNSNNGHDDNDENNNYTSSEHLGEIYRQAIRMNAENKINAGNSWGLKLIENMDKFITVDTNDTNGGGNKGGGDGDASPRSSSSSNNEDHARSELKAARKMKSKDEKGRVNFTKASCTLDASVKIYSYRVDDVHLSSYRVLANLNRTDNNNKGSNNDGDGGMGVDEDGMDGGEKTVKKRSGPKGPTETLESNLANINMSKLDSAYDIDPLFHKMSKSFDEGGAKGLLLGNLGVSQHGCRIVFDSKEDDNNGAVGDDKVLVTKLDKIHEEEGDEVKKEEEEENVDEFNIDPDEAKVWNEGEIDITNLASKLEAMIASYGHRTSNSVPFVPQLDSLRRDYAKLEEEGYAVDENGGKEGRKRLKLYDAPEEEEREAERSIHVIAMERSRGSVLGMTFDTNFDLDDDGDNGTDFGGGEDFGGEGEFAPDTGSFGGGEGEFSPDFGSSIGGGEDSQPGTFVDARSYNNTKVLLDALCNGDAFYEGGSGGNSDYAFFDMKKFEKATDGNLWAGSQHWKKKPTAKNKDKNAAGKKTVMFDEATGEKKERKKAVKKDRAFIDFTVVPDVDAIFEKKKSIKKPKKSRKDQYQMPQAEKDFVLPPDANVNISQLTRLFSRPNAVVRRANGNNDEPVGKTVGFYDVEDNGLGFDDDDGGDFGGDNGGFTFAYGEEDDDQAAGEDDDVDYNVDGFDEVRKVEKIDIGYATVAKKVDVRRLKKDLWSELEEKTAWVAPEDFQDEKRDDDEENQDDIFDDEERPKGDTQYVSFKDTVEKMDTAQSQNDVTVSFYFICCLHLANEKGLKLDSTGLEDFMISLDDGSAPTFGTFGDGFTQTASKLKGK